MVVEDREREAKQLRRLAQRLAGNTNDYDTLLERIGDARLVLLGEATHGTHEFYRERAQITKRLIQELGFDAVAVEADWPGAYRVNLHVTGRGNDAEAIDSLAGFKRFPAWMWRNADVLDFVGWLADFNRRESKRVGFFGLDLYSLYSSMEIIVKYLERIDPDAARRARERYSCFDHFGEDSQAYGYATGLGLVASCEHDVVRQLMEVRERANLWLTQDGRALEEDIFFIEQNARLVKNAEQYYRSMFRGRVSTWNLRDLHMTDTLDALAAHLDQRVSRSKIVVWAHNSHLGDARATDMGAAGEWNVGQLVRERHRNDVVSVGFTTYDGTVTAASNWDAPAEHKTVRPALSTSYEAIFHDVGIPRFLLVFDDSTSRALRGRHLERAIGVIYRPKTERASHYFNAEIPGQFDAVIHIDRTRAVEPLERTAAWSSEAPETYPFAV